MLEKLSRNYACDRALYESQIGTVTYQVAHLRQIPRPSIVYRAKVYLVEIIRH